MKPGKKLRRIRIYLYLISIIVILYGCAVGNQPVLWKTTGDIDYNKSVKVNVYATVEMPADEIEFIKQNIEEQLKSLFTGTSEGIYVLNVTITKYDEGDSDARLMMAGLGKMYLHGTVKITESEAEIEIRDGMFKKKYSMGGVIGNLATMRKDMSSKVGIAIAEALKNKK